MSRIIPNAGRVLRRAWSVRLIVAAFVLTALEVGMPFMDGYVDIPRGWFAALAGLASAGAFVARFVAQQSISGGWNADQ
jgi:hypothetical protein